MTVMIDLYIFFCEICVCWVFPTNKRVDRDSVTLFSNNVTKNFARVVEVRINVYSTHYTK